MAASTNNTATDSRLTGLIALVTGGSRGIGEGCVRCLHAAGASVVFCSNAPEEGRKLQTDLGNDRAMFVEGDCCVEADIQRVVKSTVERFGGLDCLVNNVGTHPKHGPIDEFTADDFRKLFELNVMSAFLFTQQAIPHLRRSKRSPSIINIGSMVGVLGQPGAVTYVATKGAMSAMVKALAIDEAAYGVRANCILPSNIDTPLMRECTRTKIEDPSNTAQLEAELSKVGNLQLMGKMGSIQDVGNACVFLASFNASFLTGIDLYMSGGSELKYAEKVMKKHAM